MNDILNGIFVILLMIMMFEGMILINLAIIDMIKDFIKEKKEEKIKQRFYIKR